MRSSHLALQSQRTKPSARAQRLAKKFIIIDGHVDLPHRLHRGLNKGKLSENPAQQTPKGHFDAVRARAGGLDAPFMSIYIPASYQKSGGAKKLADSLIDLVEGLVKATPAVFSLAPTSADVRANFQAKKISLPLGIENGAAPRES